MNAQAILSKIEDDAVKAADALKNEAARKAEALKQASAQKVAAMHGQTVKQAESESAALKDRMGRMAQLENRKTLLEMKRQVIDEAFEAARQALCGQPAEKTRAFMLKNLQAFAQGDERLLVGADNDGWFDEGFLSELNQKLKGKLVLAEGRREGVTGAVLLRGGTEVYATYESLLSGDRAALETEIANILFNE